MDKERQHIDFEIIYRKLTGISTGNDEEVLAQWLEEDVENLEFFRNVEKHFSRKIESMTLKEVEAALQKVKRSRRHYLRLKTVIKYASSVAAVLLAMFVISYLLLPIQDKVEDSPLTQIFPTPPSAIVSGKNKAVLTVDNGDSYALSDEEDLSLDQGDVQITKQGTAIEYVAAASNSLEELKYNTLSVPYGGEFFMTLSDGTRVRLNSGSVLRYPIKFTENERLVELEGEAFFEVTPNINAPFRVQSRQQIVEALGTSFNVTAYADDENILTTLVSGKVKVYVSDNPDKNEILLPGAQSCFSSETHILRQYDVDVEAFVAWKNGWFVFRNATLNDMMKTLARWYNVDVIFENKNISSIKFTGDIERYDDLNKLLSIIEKTNEVKIKIEGRRIVMR